MDLDKIEARKARLFPVLPDSRKEEKATSILLAVFAAVPDFAREVLDDAGVSIGKRSKIRCCTEVVFKGSNSELRPDGLIVVEKASGDWTALVETKVGRAELTSKQVEAYLDIAKKQDYDAVITISNQFAALPTHHPVVASRTKAELYHFSWMSIVTRALALSDSKAISDSDKLMLEELTHYLQHNASGVTSDIRMSGNWRNVCQNIHQNAILNKKDDEVAGAVSDWFQLLRYLSIRLSKKLGHKPCHVWMSNKHKKDPEMRLSDAISDLVEKKELSAEIEVPNAAGRIALTVSLARKTIDLGVNIQTPKDRKQPLAAINFVLGQMKNCKKEDIRVRVNWPRRMMPTEMFLTEALDEDAKKRLVPSDFKELPTSVDILRTVDLGSAEIKSASKLPEKAGEKLICFYNDAVQGMKQWVPKAPKLRTEPELEDVPDNESEESVGVSSVVQDVATTSSESPDDM